MSTLYSEAVDTARSYYNSEDADNFYFHIWGGDDIHIGIYESEYEDIAAASQRTIALMASHLDKVDLDVQVIDLGSGYGGAARWLARTYGCKVSCINLSETQNDRNRNISADLDLQDRIEVIDGSFEELDFPMKQFDVAWSQDAILHSPRRARVLEEVDRVLKPGGQFIFTDPMQSDNCPEGVLQPVLDRIHLESLGSFSFYRQQAALLGWKERSVTDLTQHLILHYSRVRDELTARREELVRIVSGEYIERMIQGLGHWIDGGHRGFLSWGIMHFQKHG